MSESDFQRKFNEIKVGAEAAESRLCLRSAETAQTMQIPNFEAEKEFEQFLGVVESLLNEELGSSAKDESLKTLENFIAKFCAESAKNCQVIENDLIKIHSQIAKKD